MNEYVLAYAKYSESVVNNTITQEVRDNLMKYYNDDPNRSTSAEILFFLFKTARDRVLSGESVQNAMEFIADEYAGLNLNSVYGDYSALEVLMRTPLEFLGDTDDKLIDKLAILAEPAINSENISDEVFGYCASILERVVHDGLVKANRELTSKLISVLDRSPGASNKVNLFRIIVSSVMYLDKDF